MIGASARMTPVAGVMLIGTARNSVGSARIGLAIVLLVAHLLEPFNCLAVERLLNCDMLHRCLGRCAVPMFLADREPDDIAGTDLLDPPAFALHAAAAKQYDQGLSKRVRVPRCPRTWLKGHRSGAGACRCGRVEERVDPYDTGEP